MTENDSEELIVCVCPACICCLPVQADLLGKSITCPHCNTMLVLKYDNTNEHITELIKNDPDWSDRDYFYYELAGDGND